jgi:hypothetical protein
MVSTSLRGDFGGENCKKWVQGKKKTPRLRVREVSIKPEYPGSSLAVFYVEQVALNRHDQSMSKLARPLYITIPRPDQCLTCFLSHIAFSVLQLLTILFFEQSFLASVVAMRSISHHHGFASPKVLFFSKVLRESTIHEIHEPRHTNLHESRSCCFV